MLKRAAFALAALGLLTACGGEAGSTPSPSQTPSKDPIVSCAEQIDYWAGEMLSNAPDKGYDYQHMGLSMSKYLELRAIVKQAKALKAKNQLSPTWVHEQSIAACRRIAAQPKPTGGGWPG